MPIEAKPLFRPDVLRSHLAGFELPAHVEGLRPKLKHWSDLLASGKVNTFTEQEILPDFLTDFFVEVLGYTRPADGGPPIRFPARSMSKWRASLRTLFWATSAPEPTSSSLP